MKEILNGRMVADLLQDNLKEKVAALPFKPTLVVVLVGNDPASEIYVRNKKRACEKVGIISKEIKLPETTTQEALLKIIAELNLEKEVDGILVQLPLPKQIDEAKIIAAINPLKDVDGFHPENVGNLFLGHPTFVPATPKGIMLLLNHYHLSVAGKTAVVVGRSNIVGKPMGQLLLQENATVIMTHSQTKNLKEMTRLGDILVVAVGKRHLITEDFVKEGAIVIDVGMNRDEKGKLSGDVDFENVKEKASFITPVPKGVGPMTITALLEQTVQGAVKRRGDFS